MEGDTAIAEAMASLHYLGFELKAPGTAIHNGDYVAQYVIGLTPAMAVYRLQDGKFRNVWIVNP